MLSCSRGTGFLFFTVSFTAFKCVFIAMSTPGLDDQGFGFSFEVEGLGFRVSDSASRSRVSGLECAARVLCLRAANSCLVWVTVG